MKSIHDPRYVQLISLLIKSRESAQVTQVELAKRLSKPQSFVAKVENLDRRVDLVELADWVSALGINRQEFINRLSWW
ncbi:helix-turn-helix domain-containing protein [Duganella sacchari]|uniref:helix-turn-helix domain-containing protein n=1 Tax=Duganella sacchari TaxID=551987 RepID=UPI0009343C49|nr:helix-turn-helix transcriptional regulator [Duganella sacchari]